MPQLLSAFEINTSSTKGTPLFIAARGPRREHSKFDVSLLILLSRFLGQSNVTCYYENTFNDLVKLFMGLGRQVWYQ